MSKDAEKRAVEALYLVDEWQTIGRGTIEARPVDKTPKCSCGLDAVLARYAGTRT